MHEPLGLSPATAKTNTSININCVKIQENVDILCDTQFVFPRCPAMHLEFQLFGKQRDDE